MMSSSESRCNTRENRSDPEDTTLQYHLIKLILDPKTVSVQPEYKSSRLLHFFEFDYTDDLEPARFLGEGSYGPVITGRNRVDKTVKAINIMHINRPNLAREMRVDMQEEAKVFCRLDCDNIVR